MLSYILVPEGSSDRALIPIINWCIRQLYINDLNPGVADFSSLRTKPKTVLEKLKAAHQLYPNTNLFIVHRDSDNVLPRVREQEVWLAKSSINKCRPTLPIIPTKMMEAWLLIDERAIYNAVNNPSGRNLFVPPRLNAIEGIRDPKHALKTFLNSASGLSRRRRAIDFSECRQRCAMSITQFPNLQSLPSFQSFRQEMHLFLAGLP